MSQSSTDCRSLYVMSELKSWDYYKHCTVLQLNVCSPSLPADPRLKWMKESSSCSPHHHVAFLKTHKCASTAVQNILFRYGEKYNLLFALPTHNYFGGGTRYVNKAMIDSEFVNKLGFDIYAVHSKWNMTEMKKIMPEETKFVTIVREPTELFLSLFDYTGMQDTTGMNLETFIRRVGPNGYRKFGYVGYNQMAWDLGLPSGSFKDMEAVDQLVAEADDLFDLVMVAERMPESLVLLRQLLCGDFEDVVVLQVNARKGVVKNNVTLGEESVQLLQQRLVPDKKIYSHFYKKFEGLVKSYGQDRMARDLAKYNETSLARQETCAIKMVDGAQVLGIHEMHKQKVVGYITNSTDPTCRALVTAEIAYFNKLRMDQTKTVLTRLRAEGKAPLHMAAVHGGIPLINLAKPEHKLNQADHLVD
ncbi:Galactose-3-O-sulfotransferase [Trinorchestia longiramus]|nr:Galactose-3-O-sulfotransferase [Trinorchestia longiramus]